MYETGKTVNRPSMTKYLNFIQPVCCNAHNTHRVYSTCVLVTWWCAMVLNYLIFSWCFHFILFHFISVVIFLSIHLIWSQLFPSLFELNTTFLGLPELEAAKEKTKMMTTTTTATATTKNAPTMTFSVVVAIEFIYYVHLCICWMHSI